MAKYPKVNYIGNKEKLSDWILSEMPVKEGTVLDLFAGGCSVSYALKAGGYRVISNDILYADYVIARAAVPRPRRWWRIRTSGWRRIFSQDRSVMRGWRSLRNDLLFWESGSTIQRRCGSLLIWRRSPRHWMGTGGIFFWHCCGGP